MIFKSRQVNLDPEPYVLYGYPERRYAIAVSGVETYDPRPEFEPTRDPLPWMGKFGDASHSAIRGGGFEGEAFDWAPRREQFDTPVNPILAGLREDDSPNRATLLLDYLDHDAVFMTDWTSEQIDHARKVLTRLANLTV